MGEGHKVHVARQQHQLDRHQQHDQVFAVQEDAGDGDRKQHGAQRQKMAQCEAHGWVSSGAAAGAGRVADMDTTDKRSAALTLTCRPGLMALLSLRWRRVKAMAVTMATSNSTAAT